MCGATKSAKRCLAVLAFTPQIGRRGPRQYYNNKVTIWIVQVAVDIDELKYSRSVTFAVNYSPVRLDENG